MLGKNTGNLKDLKSLLYFHHPKVTTFNNLVPILLERAVQGERYRERKNFTCISHFLGISPKQKHQALLWPGLNPLYLCHTWIACSSIHLTGCPVFHNPTNRSAPPVRDCGCRDTPDPSICVSCFLLVARQRNYFLNKRD